MNLDNDIAELEALIQVTPISTEYVDLLNQLGFELLKQDRSNQRVLAILSESYELCTARFPKYRTGLINALITMGEYHRFQHNYAEVMRLHIEAESMCLIEGDQTDLIRLRSAQSMLAYMMANWTRYITINVELVKLSQEADQPIMEAAGYHSLSTAYLSLNNLDDAIRYQEKAIAVAATFSDKTKFAFYQLGLSVLYSRLKQYDKALHYAMLAYEFFRSKDSDHEARTLETLGDLYSEMGDYEQALHYFQRELDLIDLINFDFFRPTVQCKLGMVYQQMGNAKLALHWLESGILRAEADTRTPILINNYPFLVRAYKDNQDFKKALAIMEKFDALKTEVHDTALDKQRSAMLIMYETEQARVEAKVQRKRARDLEKQAQLDRQYFEELTQLQRETLHALTHDLKNPLAAIMLKAEILQRRIGDEFHHHLMAIENQVMLMNNLIMDMLEIAKLETKRALDLSLNSLTSLLDIVIQENRTQAENKAITINFKQPKNNNEYTLYFDSKYLHRDLNNLLSNAIKYSPEQAQITIALFRSNDELTICISDTGYGISADHLPHIFKRFYRAHEIEHQHIEGTGLGLSIVKSIIEQHNGHICVESTAGVGTTFTIHLPLQPVTQDLKN